MLLKTKLAILFSYLTDSWRKLGFILFQQRFWESECNRLIKISTRIVHFNLRADMCYTRRKYFSFLIFLLILSILFYSFSFIFFSFSFLVFPVTFFSLFSFPFLQIFFHYLRPFLYLPLIDFLFPPRSHLLILFLPPHYYTHRFLPHLQIFSTPTNKLTLYRRQNTRRPSHIDTPEETGLKLNCTYSTRSRYCVLSVQDVFGAWTLQPISKAQINEGRRLVKFKVSRRMTLSVFRFLPRV